MLVGDLQQLYADGRRSLVRAAAGRPARAGAALLRLQHRGGDGRGRPHRGPEGRDGGFFVRELQTPTWMRALSDRDTDASFSVRPDHQWTGAYPAWPPNAAAALYRFGRADLAAPWLHGLARSANQGPFGQSHFADGVLRPESGGAIKAPAELPWINDWTCSANGAWVALVVQSVFGVRIGLDGSVDRSAAAGRARPGGAAGRAAGAGTHLGRRPLGRARAHVTVVAVDLGGTRLKSAVLTDGVPGPVTAVRARRGLAAGAARRCAGASAVALCVPGLGRSTGGWSSLPGSFPASRTPICQRFSGSRCWSW